MTIACPDSTRVADLPSGFPAYLGYADGNDPTAAELRARFPAAEHIILTVTGGTFACNGADVEPGNLSAASGARWAAGYLNGRHGLAPVLYASTIGQTGFGMQAVIRELSARNISRGEVRLLSAHYGDGPHVCGPNSCRLIDTEMDGTQWTDKAQGLGGSVIDMSMLAADFFGTLTPTEQLVQELGIVRKGATGAAAKTVQGLVNARGLPTVIDGVFGPVTEAEVKNLQHSAGITADGIVGPATWPVLLGVA